MGLFNNFILLKAMCNWLVASSSFSGKDLKTKVALRQRVGSSKTSGVTFAGYEAYVCWLQRANCKILVPLIGVSKLGFFFL